MPESSSQPPASRPRVVIVDDHPHFRFALRSLLVTEGFEIVAEAEDGAGAIAAVSAEQPDLALVDLRMPGLTGPEALTGMRAAAPVTRFIVLSGSERTEDIAAAHDAGADGYVVKGGDHDGLVAVMRAVLDGPGPAA